MSVAAVTDKAETLAGADSSRTLNGSYVSSDYSAEEDTVPSQNESVVVTAKPGDLHKSEPGLRQPLVCKYILNYYGNSVISIQSIIWSFGYNSTLPVHNLSDTNRKVCNYFCYITD